jgi:hypothetical protein
MEVSIAAGKITKALIIMFKTTTLSNKVTLDSCPIETRSRQSSFSALCKTTKMCVWSSVNTLNF